MPGNLSLKVREYHYNLKLSIISSSVIEEDKTVSNAHDLETPTPHLTTRIF